MPKGCARREEPSHVDTCRKASRVARELPAEGPVRLSHT